MEHAKRTLLKLAVVGLVGLPAALYAASGRFELRANAIFRGCPEGWTLVAGGMGGFERSHNFTLAPESWRECLPPRGSGDVLYRLPDDYGPRVVPDVNRELERRRRRAQPSAPPSDAATAPADDGDHDAEAPGDEPDPHMHGITACAPAEWADPDQVDKVLLTCAGFPIVVASRVTDDDDCVEESIEKDVQAHLWRDDAAVIVSRGNAGCELLVPEERRLRVGSIQALADPKRKIMEVLLDRTVGEVVAPPDEAACEANGTPPDNCQGEVEQRRSEEATVFLAPSTDTLTLCVDSALFTVDAAPDALSGTAKSRLPGYVVGRIAVTSTGWLGWEQAGCAAQPRRGSRGRGR